MRNLYKNRLRSGTSLILAACLFVAFVILVNTLLTAWRIDLTEHKLFTLSDGTKNILRDLSEPITLDFYFSQKKMIKLPQLANYATRVRDMLEEYAAYADGKIMLNIIEPESFSEAEDQAVASGLYGMTVNISGDRAYFGLVGANSTDDEQVIPFFQPDREAMVEYDISKLIYNLSFPDKRVVGVAGSLPMFADQSGAKDWTIINALREFFVVRDIGVQPTSISQDIDVLLIAHPKAFSDAEYYALDQYLLNGGKAMIFIDPIAEQDRSQPSSEESVMPKIDSYLHKILDHWGVTMAEQKIAADINAAMRVQARGPRGPYQIKYLPWLRLTEANFSGDDFVTSELQLLNMGTVGSIDVDDSKALTVTPLIQTSTEAMVLERDLVLFQPDPTVILNNFKAEGRRLLLAARIQGTVKTAYPEGWPADNAAAKDDLVTQGKINVVLVSDTDVLADHFWVRSQNVLGNMVPQAIANNGDFIINSIEHLSGSSDLISLRSRGKYVRPFTVVDEIRKQAELQFRKREQELRQKLEETEQMIRSLQEKLNPDDAYILGAAQSKEIEKFRQDQLKTRKQLRAVQHELQKNIEQLGAQVRFINIGLVPLLVVLLAAGLGLYRSRRHI